ncbi:MAG: glycosyltransferase [Saprospiraceae bacterium]|nr:glycosyltransferase [Saprospiraceae bacterium]
MKFLNRTLDVGLLDVGLLDVGQVPACSSSPMSNVQQSNVQQSNSPAVHCPAVQHPMSNSPTSNVQRPRTIVLISPAHPLRGGIAASSERLAQALLDAGHEVVIYSFSLQYPAFLFPGKTQFTDDPAPKDLRIKTRLNAVNPFNWLLVGREIAKEDPDQVIVRFWLPFMGPSLGAVLRMARLFARNKFRTTGLVDNIIPHEKRFGDRAFAQWFVSACDDFVVMSKSVGEEIRSFLPASKNIEGAVRFAPHPIYDTYGDPLEKREARRLLKLPENVPLVLFFGFIRKYKGLDLLLEALGQAPDIHAVVAGECYEDWGFYQKIIDENGLAERVHWFTDFIPAEQVRVFFSAADLVVQPYRSATQSGISQIAYHFEKPMVVTNVGGLPEIVTDGVSGYVVDPEPIAIAGAVRDFFENDRETAMREGVKAEKRRFSWEHLVEQLFA